MVWILIWTNPDSWTQIYPVIKGVFTSFNDAFLSIPEENRYTGYTVEGWEGTKRVKTIDIREWKEGKIKA